MFPINKFNITKLSEQGNLGEFQIGPLPTGYGHTIGNTFRRILLSSLEGAAITSVNIKGVQHEYATLAGVQDDILSLVLAIKEVAVISYSDEPVTVTLNVKGSKSGPVTVTAADINVTNGVQIVNKDQVITVLSDEKAVLDAEIVVQKGFGYALPNDDVRSEVGTIPLDAVFNPVKMVSVNVVNTRVAQKTDLDQVNLVIQTNGSITPSAAITLAADILVQIANQLATSSVSMLTPKSQSEVNASSLPLGAIEEVSTTEGAAILVKDLNLSTRLTNALVNSDYLDLRLLDGMTENDLANIKGMGEKSLSELLDVLLSYGIKVK